MGLLLIKPAELLLFYTGADKRYLTPFPPHLFHLFDTFSTFSERGLIAMAQQML
jgi:hypothetical protein